MKCKECGAWTSIIETRITSDGIRRRRECPNGHRISTKAPRKAPEKEALLVRKQSLNQMIAAKLGVPSESVRNVLSYMRARDAGAPWPKHPNQSLETRILLYLHERKKTDAH